MKTLDLVSQAPVEQVRQAAAQFVLENFGDRISVGKPTPGTDFGSQIWTAPIHVDVSGQKRQVGTIKVDAQTSEIIDPPNAQEVLNRVRTAQSSSAN